MLYGAADVLDRRGIMKYVVILGDGMADWPIEELGGLTPLAYAKTPAMDELAAVSEIGTVATIPEGMAPGSDTANLSVMGYNPKQYYTGRSPLEALSIGVDMKESDVVFRCNIVTLTEDEKLP
jgi:2,3-bisphosphoglycerate-independent phosphoglycerate mutase